MLWLVAIGNHAHMCIQTPCMPGSRSVPHVLSFLPSVDGFGLADGHCAIRSMWSVAQQIVQLGPAIAPLIFRRLPLPRPICLLCCIPIYWACFTAILYVAACHSSSLQQRQICQQP